MRHLYSVLHCPETEKFTQVEIGQGSQTSTGRLDALVLASVRFRPPVLAHAFDLNGFNDMFSDFVDNNPDAFKDAYWDIASIRVYT